MIIKPLTIKSKIQSSILAIICKLLYSDILGYDPANFRFVWVEKNHLIESLSALFQELISEGRIGYERALKD